MRILVRREKSGESTVGRIFVGTMNIRPSGMTTSLSRPFLKHDVGFAVGVVGADELIAQSDFAAEIGGPGLFGEERIGAGFDEAAIGVVGDNDSAEARGGFEQNILDLCHTGAGLALFFERERGREAGDSAADDGDFFIRGIKKLLATSLGP